MAILEDRVPGKPGRVLVTPENGGEAFYATLELADEPVVAGNKVNRQNVIDTIVSVLREKELLDMQVVTGAYYGDGEFVTVDYDSSSKTTSVTGSGRKITLGFRPDLVILIQGGNGYSSPSIFYEGVVTGYWIASNIHTDTRYSQQPFKFANDGFYVAGVAYTGGSVSATTNKENFIYYYLAIKF